MLTCWSVLQHESQEPPAAKDLSDRSPLMLKEARGCANLELQVALNVKPRTCSPGAAGNPNLRPIPACQVHRSSQVSSVLDLKTSIARFIMAA